MIWIAQLGGSNETASSPCQNTVLCSFFCALVVPKIGNRASLKSWHVILGLTSEFLRWVVEVTCVWLYHTAVVNKSVDMTVCESSMIYTIKDFKTQYSLMKHFCMTWCKQENDEKRKCKYSNATVGILSFMILTPLVWGILMKYLYN